MTFYVVYRSPRDFPGSFVVRRWTVVPGNPEPQPDERVIVVARTLDAARWCLPPELTRLDRFVDDDPTIVEVWL